MSENQFDVGKFGNEFVFWGTKNISKQILICFLYSL